MKKLFLFVLILQSTLAFSQNKTLILTKEQNTKWFEELKTRNLESQLGMIKDRILNDTSIFIRVSNPDGIKSSVPQESVKNKVAGQCRLVYVISYNQKKVFSLIFNNSFPAQKIVLITNLINTENFTGIETLEGTTATAMCGSNGDCGVIMLKTDKEEVLNKIKSIVFGKKQ